MSLRPKLLVVEDDAAIRRLVRAAIERGGYEGLEAPTAREGLSLADVAHPDLALLDLGLPDRDGIELIQLLRNRGVAVIVISARHDTAEKVAALDLGADDYLTKPFDTDELLARIRSALRRRASDPAGRTRIESGEVTIDLELRRVSRGGVDVHLPVKEFGVLEALARHAGRVVTHADLLTTVWGPGQADRVDYLRIVVRNLRQKLERDPASPQLLRTELGVGYRFLEIEAA
jgi:two-component system, OmpR family, KDP operon response regulator KdpE